MISNIFHSLQCISFVSECLEVSIQDAVRIFRENVTEAFVYEVINISSSKGESKK